MGTERKAEGALHLGIYRQKEAVAGICSIYVTFLQQKSDIESSFNNRTPSFKTSQILHDGSLIDKFNLIGCNLLISKLETSPEGSQVDGFVFFCDFVITYLSDWAFCPKKIVEPP